jgi:lipoate synthase
MNHNLETIPRLYKEARPGSDYQFSLDLLKRFKAEVPGVPTKSGLMVGLGETDDEILTVMRDMRAHGIDMLTLGQYLAPSGHHLPVRRYVHPDTFKMFEARGQRDGLQPRRRGGDGAQQLPRRPAGACRGRGRQPGVARPAPRVPGAGGGHAAAPAGG